MGSPSPASPVTQTTQISQMDPRLYQWLYGTANSPGRQQIANASMLAKTMQGVQNADPTALAAWYNVPKGTDLTQFQSHTGAINPGQADPSLMQFPGKSVTPQDYYKQATAGEKEEKKSPTSTAIAAEGGELVGYAKGGKPKEQLAQPTADLNEYGLTAQQQKKFDKYETMRNAGKKFTQQQIKEYNSMKDARTQYAQANPNAAKNKTDLSLRDAQVGVTPFYDPETKQSTNPYYNRAVDVLRGMETLPGQYGQAGDAYSKLQNMANYAPKQVTGKDVEAAKYNTALADASGYSAARMNAPKDIQAQAYDAAQMNAATMQGREAKAAQINRSDVRDINAIRADVERYQAAGMQAPPALRAEMYQAAQMQGAQLQGPKSWNAPGTVQQYMDPYQQAVIDQSKFEANRQAAQQRNQMRSQATGQKAFGGSRAALQESEANRNLSYLLEDIQNKGLSQAYQQGLQQFNTAQGQGLQAGQANLQAALTTQQQNQAATNAQRQLYVQQALDAAKTSYGGELTSAQQNQIAQNAAAQFNSQSQNTAYNNYAQQQLAAQQANQSMDWNTVNQNAQLAQQAELANQQYGLGGFQSNLNNAQFAQQAAQQNQAAINQQRSQYVTQALEAAKNNYGGQLTAEQQNQIAQNAASQFNAGNQQQINLANQNALNTAGQYNAGNQQQANMANQLYGVGGFNAQTQNQQAGLTANQQNIGAMGQAGQGLLNVGQGIGSYNQNLLQNWGAAGNTLQNLAQGYYDKRQQSAQNIWGGVNTATQPATSTLLGSPFGTSYQGQYQQRKKGGKLSIKV